MAERVGVVTGASSGIGRAVSMAFVHAGARVHGVGRDKARLLEVESSLPGGAFVSECVDLTSVPDRDALCEKLACLERLDFLVHCAGVIQHGSVRESSVSGLDLMLASNVSAPYALTRALLPALTRVPGDIVFVNSSVTRYPRSYSGQFAVTQHGLVGLADALRIEVNPLGVRVLSIFPGKTATGRTERLSLETEEPYRPERLLQPESVAQTILAALALPRTAEVTEIHIRPAIKS